MYINQCTEKLDFVMTKSYEKKTKTISKKDGHKKIYLFQINAKNKIKVKQNNVKKRKKKGKKIKINFQKKDKIKKHNELKK